MESASAEVVISRNAKAEDAALAQVMSVITRDLHAAVEDIEPTQDEWFKAIRFLTATGHTHRLAAGSDPAIRRDRRVDADRCDQQPQTVGRVGKHGAGPVPFGRFGRILFGIKCLSGLEG
jgi:hypothetical protein